MPPAAAAATIPASRMRHGLQVVHASINNFATTYRSWLTQAPSYSYGPALTAQQGCSYSPNAETMARAHCPISGPRWDEHRERMSASTSIKGLTVLRSQVESELAALERLAAERGSWQEPHPYSNGTHQIRLWEEVLYVAFTFGPVVSIQDRFAFSLSAALRRRNKMRKPKGENVNSQSVKVDVVAQNGDRWTRLYIVKPERLRQEFREAESYMVDEPDDSSSASDNDQEERNETSANGDEFQEHHHTAQCSTHDDDNSSIAFDVAARKCSLTKLIHELRAAADTEARARVQRSEAIGRKIELVRIHVEIVVTRMELQTPSSPLPSTSTKGYEAALAQFYQLPEWDRFNHRLAAIADEARKYNVDMVFGYRSLPPSLLEGFQPPSAALMNEAEVAKPMGLPKIPSAPERPQWRTTRRINLDVTAMIALVSDTTHGVFSEEERSALDESKRHPKLDAGEQGSGARWQHHFRTFSIRKEALEARAAELSLQNDQQDEASRALDIAAAKEGRALAIQLEREMTVETLFDAILSHADSDGEGEAVELFATVGAFDRLRRVSATVGGPNEKRRVKALLGDAGVNPCDFWASSKWSSPQHASLRARIVLPIQPLRDLGPGGFPSLSALRQVYPDLARAHFISHMVDTLETCLTELWGSDWRDICEDLPRSKYKKLRQSTVHQAGGQTYTTLRSMHACARYGMTTLTSNMDSIQWLLKEMARRPYSDQTGAILNDREGKGRGDEFYSCFIVLHPRSLSEQMRVTTTAPKWREVLEGYPGDLGPTPTSNGDTKCAGEMLEGYPGDLGTTPPPSTSNGDTKCAGEVQGYTIDDSERITSSEGIAYSIDPIAATAARQMEETNNSSLPGSSRSDSIRTSTAPDPIKKPTTPITPLGPQSEMQPMYVLDDTTDPYTPREGRRRLRGRARRWWFGPTPSAPLTLRGYRWWPFTHLERPWIRLTAPLAWKDPCSTSDGDYFSSHSHSHSHSYSDSTPSEAWWRAIKADTTLNKLHWLTLVLVYIGWILGFSYLAKSLWYQSSIVGVDSVSRSPSFLTCTATYWLRNAQCGLNGDDCQPFYTPANQVGQPFRCPAGCLDTTLLNPRAVGSELVNYQPLVVGGGDANATYRADSFVCAAAIHAGVLENGKGGCGSLRLTGAFGDFIGSKRNGVDSIGFNSTFPISYRFEATQSSGSCTDRRWEGYLVNAILSAFVGFVLRPKRIVWFWTLACVGFWHIFLISEPCEYPPPIGKGIGDLLPFLFVCYAIWRLAFRFVWPAFSHMPVEATFWTLGFWWLGVLLNVVFGKVPIQRLVARDIAQQPGSVVAVIVLAVVVLVIAVNQVRVMSRTGYLPKYLSLYIVGGVLVGLAAAVPGETLRLHHYIIALILLPACAFPTRLCLVYIAFLLGMFTNGMARWSFDGLIEDNGVVQGDATGGTGTPSFNTTNTTFPSAGGVVAWNPIPADQVGEWDGFQLLVDGVLRYAGAELSYNLSSLQEVYAVERQSTNQSVVPSNATIRGGDHYIRLAYSSQGSPGDFTMAAVANIDSGKWVDAPPGAT